VWLVEFDSAPAVVKQIAGGTDPSARYAREVAALGLAARASHPVAPEVLGTDQQNHVMVLEHIASRPPAPDWVIDYASALARLHATTTRQDGDLLPRHRGPDSRDIAAFLALARALDVQVSPLAVTQLEQLCARLQARDGHALLHGDPCPGNDLHTDRGVRFVDLEQAALGNGLVELAYLRIGFPTCWCVTETPATLREQAEQAYHDQWQAETGGEPASDLADACAGWLIQGDALVQRAHRDSVDHLARVIQRDWRWGTITARRRLLHRTAVVADMADIDTELAEVGRLCRSLHDSMTRHWPERAAESLPVIRAHTS
jgi:aminoglycoside phosphotransferase (APT) family kinase protein